MRSYSRTRSKPIEVLPATHNAPPPVSPLLAPSQVPIQIDEPVVVHTVDDPEAVLEDEYKESGTNPTSSAASSTEHEDEYSRPLYYQQRLAALRQQRIAARRVQRFWRARDRARSIAALKLQRLWRDRARMIRAYSQRWLTR